MSSKSPCDESRCFCRGNSLHYVAACGDCRGTECENCDKCEALTDDTDQIEDLDDDVCDNLIDNFLFSH